jgi:hypothetical protein
VPDHEMPARDLRRLTDPLLVDPVIAPTPVAEIRRRAARRSRQRAGALAVIVVALLAVGGTALARAGRQGPPVQVGTTTATGAPFPDLRVFLNTDVTAAQTAAIQARLLADPNVTDLVFADHNEVYSEFRCLFAGQPDLEESVTPSELPVSFYVYVAGGQTEATQLEHAIDGMAGVKEVSFKPGLIQPPVSFTIPAGASAGSMVERVPVPSQRRCPFTGSTIR